jgi:exodeoxyribonuclease V alpha subunit
MAERLEGMIERVTFHNEETGFAVLRVQAAGHKQLVTVIGVLAQVTAGEYVAAEGEWTEDPEHGLQFKATTQKTMPPDTTEGIKRYLGSGLVKGIGPHYADKIVQAFGDRTLTVIDESPAFLNEVKGLGPRRIQRIRESWKEQKVIRAIMIFLHGHGIGPNRAIRIYKTYGGQAIARVKENPYSLASDIWGIGFATADKLAERLGVDRASPLRARAALRHALQQASDLGHSCYPRGELLERSRQLTGMDPGRLERELLAGCREGDFVLEVAADAEWIYWRPFHLAEKGIAGSLARLMAVRHPLGPVDVQAALTWVEKKLEIELAGSQREALGRSMTDKVLIVTGGPGVGKTTIVRGMLQAFEARGKKVMLAAPTGRAAKRLSEATGRPASTIHRLLQFDPARGGFVHDRDKPLELNVLILDEVSMIDVLLMNQVLKALPDHAALVLVGDRDQLPSVGPGCVLSDLIESGAIGTVRLTTIFRQAQTSWIVRAAHDVNHGKLPAAAPDPSGDFFFIEAEAPARILNRLTTVVRDRLPARFGLDPCRDIQVLTPMNRGELGTRNLNSVLQEMLNPADEGPAVGRFGCTFRQGDKVIQTRNDYQKEVFNGDSGRITAINEEDQELTVDFDGRPAVYDFNELDTLSLAYALTIHKSQGSEYPAVVIPLSAQHFPMLRRNLLYTGITRGRRVVVLIGTKRALSLAVGREDTARRYSGLRRQLVKVSAEMK